jgi:RHS repeat-associated protein
MGAGYVRRAGWSILDLSRFLAPLSGFETNGTSGLSDASILALANLQTDTFYNHRGQSIALFSPGGQVQKSVYDGAGRVATQYTTDGGAVNNSNAQQKDWTHAGSVSSDVVLTQKENTFDADGSTILTITRDRFHDDSTASQGGLGAPSSGIHARVSYVANYYDAANRQTDEVEIGTNGGSAYTRPSAVPSRSDTVLVTHTDYNGAGDQYLVTDPRGIYTESFFDMLNRTVETINNSTLGSPAVGSQVTIQTYDGANHVITMTAEFPGTMTNNQVTQYVYGIGGTSGTSLFSNDIITKKEFPNASTGAADTTAAGSVSYTYDLLGEQLTVTDQNGNVHTLTHDVLGRVTLDAVTTLGSGVDGSIRAHGTTFTALGMPYKLTAYSNSAATTVVNQIQNVYDGFGDLVTQYQEHSGAVNTSTSAKVQFSFAEGSGNTDRLTSMTYPNGRILDYGYSTGIDANISRLSYLKDDGGTSAGVHLEEYSYLGLSMIVIRNRPENTTQLTYLQQSGDTNAITDGGDQYTGLDRFNRVIDQFWRNTSNSAVLDRIQYAYDRDSNVLYENNLVNSAYSDLFHGNSSTSNDNLTAYDNLNRLNAYRRGTLTASGNNGSGVLDTVTTGNLNSLAGSSQSWTLDALGNWSSLTTDGTAVSGTFDSKNEETAQGSNSLSFDNNGNTTVDQNGKHYYYDAWNHLVTLKDTNNTTVLLTLQDDALNQIVVYTNNSGASDWYFDKGGRMIENERSGIYAQYVYALDYTNDLILRDRNSDGSGATGAYGKSSSGLDERLYAQHDANWDITSVIDTSAAAQIRITYTPYGEATLMTGSFGTANSTVTNYEWLYRFQGTRAEGTGGFAFMGARLYSIGLGRFLTQDPTSYTDGDNLYSALEGDPERYTDPTGTVGVVGFPTVPTNNGDIPGEPHILNDPLYGLALWYAIRYGNFPPDAGDWVGTNLYTRQAAYEAGGLLLADATLTDLDVSPVHSSNGTLYAQDISGFGPMSFARHRGFPDDLMKRITTIEVAGYSIMTFWKSDDVRVIGGLLGQVVKYDQKSHPDGQYAAYEAYDYAGPNGWVRKQSDPSYLNEGGRKGNIRSAFPAAGAVRMMTVARTEQWTEQKDVFNHDWRIGGTIEVYGPGGSSIHGFDLHSDGPV